MRRNIRHGELAAEHVRSGEPSTDAAAVSLSGDVRDALLRMLFVCCDDAIPIESQLVLSLKTLCGFDVGEIAERLFLTEANVYKRLARARARLREAPLLSVELTSKQLASRLAAGHALLYTLFTEGYLSSHVDSAIRRELCEDALRLTTILTGHPIGTTPETFALLALMHLHSARMPARQDGSGGLLLPEEQDRSLWDQMEIQSGLSWLARAAEGDAFPGITQTLASPRSTASHDHSPRPVGIASSSATSHDVDLRPLRRPLLNKRDTSRALSRGVAHAAREPSDTLPPPRGIVRAPKVDGLLDGRRLVPSPALAPYVHHFWWVRWALRSPFTGDTLPHPAAQILHAERAGGRRGEVVGVHTGRLARHLTGEGQMFGISFRPVMFQPLLRASMATLTNGVVPLVEVLGARSTAWSRAILEERDVAGKVAIAEAFLAPLLPPPDERMLRLRDLVESIAHDRSLLRAEDVAAAAGVDVRALQRSFQTFVGASPKRVIQRYRLHEAAAQLEGPSPPALATLAASLGYADQAHFGRDFKRAVGETPHSFARRAAAGPGRAVRTAR
jgi:AraC-like DNA-binding protein